MTLTVAFGPRQSKKQGIQPFSDANRRHSRSIFAQKRQEMIHFGVGFGTRSAPAPDSFASFAIVRRTPPPRTLRTKTNVSHPDPHSLTAAGRTPCRSAP